MSHLPERQEKVCLNCKADLRGRYCHQCGQENLEPKETFWHLVTHFVYDVTHFDGKFFATLKLLLRRPGLLSKEYIKGRRASYLNPIRMYIFTSAFFFIIFFSFIAKKNTTDVNDAKDDALKRELMFQEKRLDSLMKITTDSAELKVLEKKMRKIQREKKQWVNFGMVQLDIDETDTTRSGRVVIGDYDPKDPKTVKGYDSIQNSLPADKKDGWLKRLYKRKQIAINDKYNGREKEFWEKVQDKFMHSIPQMMFVSLPLVALLLQLFYVRRRKQFYYADHAIFVVHVYIALYILILITYFTGALNDWTGWSIFNWIGVVITFFMFYYVYKAMRNFYGQSRWKTIFKFLLLFFFCLFVFTLLMALFFLTSLLQI